MAMTNEEAKHVVIQIRESLQQRLAIQKRRLRVAVENYQRDRLVHYVDSAVLTAFHSWEDSPENEHRIGKMNQLKGAIRDIETKIERIEAIEKEWQSVGDRFTRALDASYWLE